jgi:hypothetical protein
MATVTTDDQRRRPRRARRPFAPVTLRLVVGDHAAPGRRAAHTHQQPRASSNLAATREVLLIALGILAFAALLLAALAFTRPAERAVQADVGYVQSGAFSYSAAAPPGVYDTDGARSGDAVFLRLSNRVDVSFTYRASADQPAQFGGTYRLSAEISDGAGWRRTIALQPETTFHDGAFSANATLDLPQLLAQVEAFEKQTELTGQHYTLAVVPQVMLSGTLAGQDIQDTFAPRLEFRFDKVRMQLVSSVGAADPLQPTKAGLLEVPRNEPNALTLLGLSLEIATARRLAVVGLLLALSGGLALSVALRRLTGSDEAARIQIEYGPLLLDVRAGALEACGQVIAVATIADLAKLAEREGRMILHQADGGHRYFLQDNGVTYLYQPAMSAGLAAAPHDTAPGGNEVNDAALSHRSC